MHDQVGSRPVVIALAADSVGLCLNAPDTLIFENDTLHSGDRAWNLLGQSARLGVANLESLPAFQEFWHSWSTFHPYTTRQQ